MRRHDPDGKELPRDANVFGNEVCEQVKDFKRSWRRSVLKAHGHTAGYRVRVVGNGQEARHVPTAALSAGSRATLRAIDF
jgi:hypothetical protein